MVRPMTCPICGKPVPTTADPAKSTVPFCSSRCKMIDFCRWNDGRYAIVESVDSAESLDALNPPDPEDDLDD